MGICNLRFAICDLRSAIESEPQIANCKSQIGNHATVIVGVEFPQSEATKEYVPIGVAPVVL